MPKFNLSLKKPATCTPGVNKMKLKKTAAGEYKRVNVIRSVVVRPAMPPPPPPPFRKAPEDSVLRQLLVEPPTISLLSEDEHFGGKWDDQLLNELDLVLQQPGEQEPVQQLVQQLEEEAMQVPRQLSPPPPLIPAPQQSGKNLRVLMDVMAQEAVGDILFHLPPAATVAGPVPVAAPVAAPVAVPVFTAAAVSTCTTENAVGDLLQRMEEFYSTQRQQRRDKISALLIKQQDLESEMRRTEEERNVLLRGLDEDDVELNYIKSLRGGGGGH